MIRTLRLNKRVFATLTVTLLTFQSLASAEALEESLTANQEVVKPSQRERSTFQESADLLKNTYETNKR